MFDGVHELQRHRQRRAKRVRRARGGDRRRTEIDAAHQPLDAGAPSVSPAPAGGAGTASTGRVAARIRRNVVDPKIIRCARPSPCVPTTIIASAATPREEQRRAARQRRRRTRRLWPRIDRRRAQRTFEVMPAIFRNHAGVGLRPGGAGQQRIDDRDHDEARAATSRRAAAPRRARADASEKSTPQ